MTLQNKVIYRLILSLLITGQLLIIYVVFMMVYPFKVVELTKFEVTTTVVKKGKFVCYQLEFTKTTNVKAKTIEWYIVDGVRHKISDSNSYHPVGRTAVEQCKQIPDSPAIKEDTYHLQVDINYEIFGLRKPTVISWESNDFVVID